MKRYAILAVVLALLLGLLSPASVMVMADASGTTGDCTWTLDGTALTISGHGQMADYSEQQTAPWGINITAVYIEDGVTSIGNYAFANSYSLTAITIPASINSIGDFAFSNCADLSSVNMQNGVKHIGDSAFAGCSDLQAIHLPDSVTTIGERAFAVSGLRSIQLSDNLVTIGNYAFYYCSSLTAITIPDNTTTIGAAAFYHCAKLETVNIGYGVSTIGGFAFCGCEKLTSLTIPSRVTTMGNGVFSGCSDSLTIHCSTHYVAEYAANSGMAYVLTIPTALNYTGAQASADVQGEAAIRFGFTVECSGVSRDENDNTVIANNAIVNISGKTYPLIGFGAIVSTHYPRAAALVGVDVPANKLYSIHDNGTVSYTARVTGLTADGQDHRGAAIFVNGYIKYQDGDEVKTFTTGVVTDCYNDVMAAATL